MVEQENNGGSRPSVTELLISTIRELEIIRDRLKGENARLKGEISVLEGKLERQRLRAASVVDYNADVNGNQQEYSIF